MLFLASSEILRIAERVVPGATVRDAGLIEAAAARPQAMLEGRYAYPDVVHMAAALTASLVCNHALIDGNKRLGLACLIVFLRMNGFRLDMNNDEAYELIYGIASGTCRSVPEIATILAAKTGPYRVSDSSSSSASSPS